MRNVVILFGNLLLLKQTGASYARAMCYAKALANENVRVFLASARQPDNINLETAREECPNIYVLGQPNLEGGSIWRKIRRRISYHLNLTSFFRRLREFLRSIDGELTIIVYPSFVNPLRELFLLQILQWNGGYNCFVERNELVYAMYLNQSPPSEFSRAVLFYTSMPFRVLAGVISDQFTRLYSGTIAISENMQRLLEKRSKQIMRIPILYSESSEIAARRPHRDYLSCCFTGAMAPKKEGLISFFKAMQKNMDRGQRLKFTIYGLGTQQQSHDLQRVVEQYGIVDAVIINQPVPHEKIPAILAQHDLLIMSRDKNTQTHYGFSTKLAEYMASGVPVLVTAVSDNGKYIEDGVNGFIVPPGDNKRLTQKLGEISELPCEELWLIGEQGRQTADKHFHYRHYGKPLVDFLFS